MTSNSSKTFILDTNVILHDSSCIYKFEEHDIVLPIQVIEELDSFKKGFETINFHAREFCRIIDDLSSDHIFNGGVPLGEGLGKIRVALAVPLLDKIKNNLMVHNVDTEIINLGLHLQNENPSVKVVIVSKDVNLRLKAKSLGVMAEDFLNETVTNIDSLFEEIQTIQVKNTIITSLYKNKGKNGKFIPYELENATQNRNFIFVSDNQSALVRYKDKSIKLIQKDSLYSFNIKPLNAEQAFALDVLLDSDISLVAIEAKAGTGKTIISLAAGLQQMKNKEYKKVFFSRQTISMGDREIGFLKGGIDEKIGPFMMGMTDNLDELSNINPSNKKLIEEYQTDKTLLVEPLPYIRGRSLNGVFFIIDEAQNLTPHEVKTIATRAGRGTKIVFIGDTHQIDHPFLDQRSNGLSYLIDKFRGQDCFSHVHLVKNEWSELAELAGELL